MLGMSVEMRIKKALSETFLPTHLEVVNESHLHAGHRFGGTDSHFSVAIVSEAFEGKNPVRRHQAIYACLDAFLKESVHALKISAKTPKEVQKG
jgi:stress-induced morphogen